MLYIIVWIINPSLGFTIEDWMTIKDLVSSNPHPTECEFAIR
jgi:hypothetical protein